MPRQLGSTKVRTGCRTCKVRKVKCDEGKPSCTRCVSSSRVCGGYEFAVRSPEQSLTWYRPQQLKAHDQREGRAFQFFCHNVGPYLSGPRDSYFWTHLVMQFSHFQPAVRHAVLAISSLYEDFQNGRRVSCQLPSNPLAIKHYGASISHIKTSHDENQVLLACILYICVEFLLGDVAAATKHCQAGITILRRSQCAGWTHEYLIPIFRRLSTIPFFSHLPLVEPPARPSLDPADDGNCAPFTSLAEAETHLESIETRARDLAPFRSKLSEEEKEIEQVECTKLVEEWQTRMAMLQDSQPQSEITDLISMNLLRMSHEILRIKVGHCLCYSQTAFDQFLDSFRAVVSLAAEVVEFRDRLQDSPQRPCFTFEETFLPKLAFTVNQCRDLPTRLRALTLMGELCVAKEGVIDVGTMYRSGRRVIEIEHGISLDDSFQMHCAAEHPPPPEEQRVHAMPIGHELETVENADGSISYRRIIKIMSRAADGTRLTRYEYINDEMPGNDTGIPSMRCSRPDPGFGARRSASLQA